MGIWIDTDMGFDDIAAIFVVQQAGLTIDGISLVFGNTVFDQVCANAAGAAAAFGWSFPLHAGRSGPVMGRLETAQAILGETGIPTLGQSLPRLAGHYPSLAFDALCRWLSEDTGPRRILALGPLTNIAALVLARPDLAARITDLTWMGGGVTRGNHTASAEFNALADPEAVAIILSHRLPLRMVDLDFCRKIQAGPSDVDAIRAAGGRNAGLLADLFGGFVDIALSRGRPSMALYDPAAAVAFTHPHLVTFEPARIDMECAGQFTRGRTVVETRQSHGEFNAHFAADCDAQRVKAAIIDALATEAAR
ncbi:nucleoside hydrolase [Rhizobium sp. SSA_523]|uniref:nucleoside hydrolase n=1 Tax=Rhizobium sp. SSA_523 TaxID=2952477 RepID=UPI002090977C|nr:nucleoside hydrolase [Rhizobium sp. SSA_523]MCO5732427.1 nucleoside hydrolase [Rhizobium sp. SSA_523]WKC22430.1 nucleoside hydrolase [Rhizobium sp. SSA_523]